VDYRSARRWSSEAVQNGNQEISWVVARDLDVSLIKPKTEHESFSDMGGVGVRSVLADSNNARARFKKLNAVPNLGGEVEVANIEVRTVREIKVRHRSRYGEAGVARMQGWNGGPTVGGVNRWRRVAAGAGR
jgi:hypothetical protein